MFLIVRHLSEVADGHHSLLLAEDGGLQVVGGGIGRTVGPRQLAHEGAVLLLAAHWDVLQFEVRLRGKARECFRV